MRIFSGVQPTGNIHIGNYLGALKQWVALQKNNECIFCIVDLHSLTVPYDPSNLEEKVFNKTIAYIAAGIDPNKSIIFIQSHIPEHTELTWLLSTITSIGELERMTQFKEKVSKYPGAQNAGLLNYPLLMAADILLYQTDIVPVGKDQQQHIELTRKMAKRFNNQFGEVFKIPKTRLPKSGAKIMSLQNPSQKMSKSDSPQTYISLFDEPQDIKKKIMSAKTDSEREIKYDPENKPGISNLLTIYASFSNLSIPQIEEKFKNETYQNFKKGLTKVLIEELKSFRDKKQEIENDKEKLKNILEEGREKAQQSASKTMKEVKEKMGIKY